MVLFGCLLCGLGPMGCDNTIEPFSDTGSYSVYGNLSFQDEAHFVRVRPLKKPLGTSLDSLPVTVTLMNLSSGRARTLRDSVIVFDGVRTHNYWTRFKVEPSTTYELRVEDPDRPTTSVQTTTPTGLDPVMDPDSAEECSQEMVVRLREAKAPVEIYIGFQYQGEKHWIRRAEFGSDPRHDDPILRFSPSSILSAEIPTGLREPPPCTRLDDTTLDIAFLYTDPERTVDEVDPLVSFDPTQQERVANGVGFFGAYRRDTVAVAVDTTLSFPIP